MPRLRNTKPQWIFNLAIARIFDKFEIVWDIDGITWPRVETNFVFVLVFPLIILPRALRGFFRRGWKYVWSGLGCQRENNIRVTARLPIFIFIFEIKSAIKRTERFRADSTLRRGIWKLSFIDTVRPSVDTNPPRKREFYIAVTVANFLQKSSLTVFLSAITAER